MRFKRYLTEKIITVDKEIIDDFIEKFNKVVKSYVDKYDLTKIESYDLEKYQNHIITQLNDIDPDIEFKYSSSNLLKQKNINPNSKGVQNGSYNPRTNKVSIILNIKFMEWLKDYDRNEKSLMWNVFIEKLIIILEHELIHAIQMNKRPDWEKSPERIKSWKKFTKKYGKDYYYNRKLEIMAHAKNAIEDLRKINFGNDNIKEMIKNPIKYDKSLKMSNSYKIFQNALSQKYPDNWRRFLKYMYQYLEEEM